MQREYSIDVKEMTPKQEALLKELLDGDELPDSERQELRHVFESQVSTSEDASVLITYILGLVKFRRHFVDGQ